MDSATVLADKFTGTLLGVGAGDAFGAPFEGMQRVSPEAFSNLLRVSGQLR